MLAFCVTIEGKGGVGKSTLTGLAVDALAQDGKRSIVVIDGDTTNSSMASMFDDVELIDPSEAEAAGKISAVLKSSVDFVIMDTGARSEAKMLNSILPQLMKTTKKAGIPIVVLRPITLSSFVQQNAVAFAKKVVPLGVKVLFVRMLCQGRTEEHFYDWDQSQGRQSALELGVVEMNLSDAGVRWGDEVPAYGLSFNAAAQGDFSRVDPEFLADAERLFTAGIQAHLGFWVESNAEELLKALSKLGIKK